MSTCWALNHKGYKDKLKVSKRKGDKCMIDVENTMTFNIENVKKYVEESHKKGTENSFHRKEIE